MDPSFLFATTHILQYSQFIQAQNARLKTEQDAIILSVLGEPAQNSGS
jgi:hypothetical protein